MTNRNRRPRAAMYLNGITDRTIAEICEVTELYVTLVVTGQRKGYRIREAIASACKVSVNELWPEDADPELPAAA